MSNFIRDSGPLPDAALRAIAYDNVVAKEREQLERVVRALCFELRSWAAVMTVTGLPADEARAIYYEYGPEAG